MFPGKRWIAGRVRKASSSSPGSMPARVAASSVPSRRRISSGPENAFCTVTCWSSTNPTSSASGSSASSRSASSSPVKCRCVGRVIATPRSYLEAFAFFAVFVVLVVFGFLDALEAAAFSFSAASVCRASTR